MNSFVFEEEGDDGSPTIESHTLSNESNESNEINVYKDDDGDLWIIIINFVVAFVMWKTYPRNQFVVLVALIISIVLTNIGLKFSSLLWIPVWLYLSKLSNVNRIK